MDASGSQIFNVGDDVWVLYNNKWWEGKVLGLEGSSEQHYKVEVHSMKRAMNFDKDKEMKVRV